MTPMRPKARSLNLALLTLLALGTSQAPARATVLIDGFADASVSTISNTGLYETTNAQAGAMIGGARFEGLLCYFDCYYNPPYLATLAVGAGALSVTPPLAGLATTRVLWGDTVSGSSAFPYPALGVNLSAESAIQLQFASVSAPLLVQFVVVSGGGQSVYSPVANNPGVVIAAGGPQTVTLPFSAFVGQADWSHVDGLGLVLGGNNGAGTEAALASFTLNSVSAVSAVPEPSAGLLCLAGLLAGVQVLRRRPG